MPTIHYVSVFNKEDTLIPQSDLIDSGYVQNKCPVYNHKQSRTFVATSPIDFSLSIDRSNNKISCSRPCLLYTSPSPRDKRLSRMPSSA